MNLKINHNKVLRVGRGFTLVEMLIAVALFTVITSFAIGAILSIFDANRRSQSTKTVVDNLNLSIENMVRTVRFGGNYHCGNTAPLSSPLDCSNGDTFLATTFEGNIVEYCLYNGSIYRSSSLSGDTVCGSSSMLPITSPDVVVEYMRFYVFGTTSGDNIAPHVVAVIKGYVGTKPTAQSSFSLQTTMTQRSLDL